MAFIIFLFLKNDVFLHLGPQYIPIYENVGLSPCVHVIRFVNDDVTKIKFHSIRTFIFPHWCTVGYLIIKSRW